MNRNIIINLPIRITVIIEGILGTIFNSVALIIVFKTQFGSKLTTCMLRAQPIFDFSACFLTVLYYIIQSTEDYNKSTGLYIIDVLICHTWFRNGLFWLSCIYSVQNLVCISLDRVSSVIFPTIYKTHTCQFTIMYFIYIIFMSTLLYMPAPLLRRYINNHCLMDFSVPGVDEKVFLDYCVYAWIVFAYFMPITVMLISHILIIHTIRKSHSSRLSIVSQNKESTQYIKRKISQLVVTTAVLSGQLILLHFFECIYQILIINNVIQYNYQALTGHLGPILILLSCTLNPCVLQVKVHILTQRCQSRISNRHLKVKDDSTKYSRMRKSIRIQVYFKLNLIIDAKKYLRMNGTVYVILPIRIIITIEGVIGTIFNILAIIVIFKVNIGSKFTTFLLRTQSILDLSACLSAATYSIIQSTDHYNEPTGLYIIDLLICHLWFRNAAFWLSCILSVQNLVCISLDRVSSVIILGSRKSYATKFFILYFVYMLCMLLILYIPTPLLRRYNGTQCTMDFSFPWIDTKVFLDYIVYSWIVFAYFVPVTVMLLSHIWVIYTIKKSQSPSHGDTLQNMESYLKIKRKLIQLVITTAIVSLQQALLHSFECINQILIICEVIVYTYGTPMEQMGTVLILFGCSSNPCIFVFSMAALRKRLLLLFKCKAENVSSFGTTDTKSKSLRE
ncbi:hypothetical protein MN116_003399 [Schistosoma mekongi]|uniref:G-protein coupled receptors family 1 profile domain-containing protein n=1 Tax=Schistosoma mekongi TaxID=38744 RepID=A0AAE1ZHU8_SCHME|nr:hypothetical protein MN116_003399 [Schistosoma mekongi]